MFKVAAILQVSLVDPRQQSHEKALIDTKLKLLPMHGHNASLDQLLEAADLIQSGESVPEPLLQAFAVLVIYPNIDNHLACGMTSICSRNSGWAKTVQP